MTDSLVRSRTSSMVLNTDTRDYEHQRSLRARKKREDDARREIAQLRAEVASLRETVNRILEAIGQ